MRSTRLGLVLTFAIFATVGFAQPASVAGTLPEDSLPRLKEFLQTALKQSPQMLSQNISLAQAEAGRYAANTGLWPTLGVNAGYGISGAKTLSDPPSESRGSGANYGINVGQSLFAWGVNVNRSTMGKIAVQIAEKQYADAYRTLAGSVRYQYLALVARKIYLRNTRFQVGSMDTSLSAMEAQLKEGTISEGDILIPRLTSQDFHLSLEKAEQDFEYSKRVFARLVGLEKGELPDDAVAEDLPKPNYASLEADRLLSNFLQGGVEETLQAQIYRLNIRNNELNYRIARTGLWPKFSIGANYGLSNGTSLSDGRASTTEGNTYGANIGAYWPLFDGFATRGSKLTSLATKRLSERQFQSYLETTADSAQKLRRDVDFSYRGMNIAETRRALMKDAIARVEEQIKEGTASKYVLEGTTSNFYLADYTAINARADFLNRWSEFVSMMGVDPALDQLPARYLNLNNGK